MESSGNAGVPTAYLLAFLVLLAFAVAVRAGAYSWIQHKQPTRTPHPLGRYDVALATADMERVVTTALAELVDAGAITVHPDSFPEFRINPDGAQRASDAVQRQVLELLPNSPNVRGLTSTFERTEVADDLRRGLRSAGFLSVFPGWRRVQWCVSALFPLGFVAVIVAQWSLPGDQFEYHVAVEGFATVFVWAFCEQRWPLSRPRRALQLDRKFSKLMTQSRRGDSEPSTEPLWRVRRALTEHAQELGLAPGWVDSATGMVPFLGWDGYRDEWGEEIAVERSSPPTTSAPRSRSWPNPELGRRYTFLGVALSLLPFACMWVLSESWQGTLALLIPIFIVIGVKLVKLGEKYTAVEGRAVLHTRGRPPVLYLRSFADETSTDDRLLPALTSPIEEVAAATHRFGELVAIHNPGRPLPLLGPAPISVLPEPVPGAPQERWQTEVINLMHSSTLVLIAAGRGEGLEWECAQAAWRVPPHKLVILVPPSDRAYAQFRLNTGRYFQRGLPDDARGRDMAKGRVDYGLVYFDHDWTPHFVRFRPHPLAQLHVGRIATRRSSRRTINRLLHALYPTYRNNRVPWPGIEIPVPFGRVSRHRILPGLSIGRTILLVVVAIVITAAVTSDLINFAW